MATASSDPRATLIGSNAVVCIIPDRAVVEIWLVAVMGTASTMLKLVREASALVTSSRTITSVPIAA